MDEKGEMDVTTPARSLAASAPVVAAAVSREARTSAGLRSVIDDLVGGATLGDTDVGKAWCLKALHPADTNVLSSPMPTNETKAFASVAFQQMDVLSMPATFDPAKAWSVEIFVFRMPVILYSWRATQAGAADVTGYVFSKQYQATSDYIAAHYAFREVVEKYRLTSQSLTGYFDAASLSDQGHVIVGQTDLPWMKNPATQTPPPGFDTAAQLPWVFYQDARPSMDVILQTTRAYQAHAVDGFYVPSKLQSLGRWIRTNDVSVLLGTSGVNIPPAPQIGFERLGRDAYFADCAMGTFQGTFPWLKMLPGDPAPLVFDQVDSSLTSVFYTGLSGTSSIRMTMRWTLDMVVKPGTIYAPFVKMPPIEDGLALRMYAEVSRRMIDAYPASQNNLGMLLGTIGRIATQLLPSVVPAIGSWLTGKATRRQQQTERKEIADAPSFAEEVARSLINLPGAKRTSRRFNPETGDPIDIEEEVAGGTPQALYTRLSDLIGALRGTGAGTGTTRRRKRSTGGASTSRKRKTKRKTTRRTRRKSDD